jgi:molybdate transport system ATP-binding protein
MNLYINIKKKYKDFLLSIKLESRSRALGLLGASGSGKSMTLRCLAGIETPDQGRIILNDRVIFDSEKGINIPARYRNIGLLFQSYALFPHMTVYENIRIGIKDKDNIKQRINKLLTVFSLEALQHRYPRQLSGGEQQRVAMARLFAYEPELLLLDEPFSALDSHLKEELLPELKAILSDYGKDLILVSHSKGELYQFCDNIAVLEQGSVVEYGPKKQIFTYPGRLSTARLIGCRNISGVKRLGEFELMALDWDIRLRTMERIPKGINYVGIFANNIMLVQYNGENTMQAVITEILEGPGEVNLILNKSGIADEKSRFHLTLSRAEWLILSNSRSLMLHFPKESLLLLK